MEKYPEYIMRNIRQNLGLEANDTSRDDYIMKMSKERVFKAYLEWEGIIGYTNEILSTISEIYGTNLS